MQSVRAIVLVGLDRRLREETIPELVSDALPCGGSISGGTRHFPDFRRVVQRVGE